MSESESTGSYQKKPSAVVNERCVEGEGEEEIFSLLGQAIDIDQAIVAEASLLQSISPDSPTFIGSDSDSRVDFEARKIEAKALRHGEIIDRARQRLRQMQSR